MKLLTAAAGAMLLATAFASPSSAAPMAPASTLLLNIDAASAPTQVRMNRRHMNRGNHYGWRRGHHRGWAQGRRWR